jgi:hypothetical protein
MECMYVHMNRKRVSIIFMGKRSKSLVNLLIRLSIFETYRNVILVVIHVQRACLFVVSSCVLQRAEYLTPVQLLKEHSNEKKVIRNYSSYYSYILVKTLRCGP